MAQEAQKPAATAEPPKAEAPAPVQQLKAEPTPPVQPPKAEVPAGEKELEAPAPEKEDSVPAKEASASEPEPGTTAEKPAAEAEGETATVESEKTNIIQSISFKEDTNVASELPEAQRKALEELKELVREALNKHEFTAPPPPPPPEKEEEKKEDKAVEKKAGEETEEKDTKEETKEEEKKEDKKEEKKEDTPAAPAVTETKPEEKTAAPAATETKKEEKPAVVETKPTEPAAAETKEEEKPMAPAASETKPDEKPAAPAIVAETKKEEKATAPDAVEANPVAPATTETKKEDTPAVTETKPEEKPAASESITIEKAFAADEDGAKTLEAIKESIVPVSTPEATAPAAAEELKEAEAPALPAEPEEVSVWGIPLLEDERSDVILLKFLRARDFKVKEAFSMLKKTVQWRKDFKIDELLEEDLGNEFEKMVFVHGVDKQGRTVIYSSYSEFQNKELFSDKEKLHKFLKWRIQFQEKCARALDFSPTGKSSFVFISDFKNAPGLGKRALWQFIKQAVKQFEDNYPEFVSKEVFINVPWWYIPYYRTIGSFTSPRTTSKMSLAGPSKSADAIFRYVAPEQVPVKYGGLSKEAHPEQLFTPEDAITDISLKPTSKHTIELPASEACTLAWELRVLGSDVSYGAQFEPSTEGSYTVIVSKNRKIGLTDEPVISDSFKVGEPGKVVITIDNQTSRKKKLLYRYKTLARSD